MYRILRLLYQPYKWFIFLPVLGIVTLLAGAGCVMFSGMVSQRFASQQCGRLWGRIIAYAVPMIVSAFGKAHINTGQSYVLVANHQSQLDIPLIYGWIGVDFRWVLKKELRKMPIIGMCCEKLGHIIIDRSDQATAVAAINAAKKRIGNGTSILFFPEGTRSRDGHLLPFKKGAFKFALDMGLPIVPVTIRGTRRILPPDTIGLFPGRVQMIIHPAIETKGYHDSRLDELMARTRADIAAAL